jgi:hypothetical protein
MIKSQFNSIDYIKYDTIFPNDYLLNKLCDRKVNDEIYRYVVIDMTYQSSS